MMFTRIMSLAALAGACTLIATAVVASSSVDVSNPLDTPLYDLVSDDALMSFATHSEWIPRPEASQPGAAEPGLEDPWANAAAAAHGLSVRTEGATHFAVPIAELDVGSLLAWQRAEHALSRGDLAGAEAAFGEIELPQARLAVEARICEATARILGAAACLERVEALITEDASLASLLVYAVNDDADGADMLRTRAFEGLLARFHRQTAASLGDGDDAEDDCAMLARRLYRALYLGKSPAHRDEALELARKTVAHWPAAREAWQVRLGLAQELGEVLGADELERLQASHPDLAELHVSAPEEAPGSGGVPHADPFPRARSSRKRVRAEFHDHEGPRFASVDRLVAQGKLEDAARMCREIYAEDPRCAIATHRLADVLARMGRNDAAAEKYRLALRFNPALRCVHAHLHDLGQPGSASADPLADWLERLQDGKTTPAELELLAGRLGDVEAAKELAAWLAGDESDPRILIARAAFHDGAGRRSAALADLEEALSRSPARLVWYADLVVELRGAAGDADGAAPRTRWEEQDSVLYASCREMAREEPEEALRWLQAIPLTSPLGPQALRLAARIHQDAGRSAEVELLPVHLAIVNELIVARCREWMKHDGVVGAVGRFALAEFLVDAAHELDRAEQLLSQVRKEVRAPSIDELHRHLEQFAEQVLAGGAEM